MPRRLLPLALLAALAAQASAQVRAAEPAFGAADAAAACPTGVEPARDVDGDCVDDDLEVAGYDARLDPCTPGPADCFVTDPTAWSSDGDPYSDFQEATGTNMDASVEAPYRHPLVAAAPQIEVFLTKYTYTPTATITDTQGGSVSTTESEEFSVESTVSASYTVKSEVSLTGASASAEATVSASVTAGYTASSSRTEEVNWETASSTASNAAAELTLFLTARNTGGATAKSVTPTLNLYIGGVLVGTITPSVPFPTNLTPGDAPTEALVVDRRQTGVAGETEPITLSIDQLRRLRTGAPVEVRIVGLSAEVERWSSADSNWSCGTASEPCLWESFEDQIVARTLRLTIDFGYSGDPEAVVPARHFGNPFDYRVFTGSPTLNPGFTLREVLGFLGLAEEDGAQFRIDGRPFPEAWAAVSGPQRDAQNRRFLEHWDAYATAASAWPRDLLDMPMPRRAELSLMSPAPEAGEAGPIVTTSRVRPDMRTVVVAARPKGSFAVAGGEAHLFLHGEEAVVELERVGAGGDETSYFALPSSTRLPISVASYVVLRDAWGSERTAPLAATIPQATSCADLPAEVRGSATYFGRPFEGGLGTTTVFVGGDPNTPATVFCYGTAASPGTDYWYPQAHGQGTSELRGVAVLDIDRRVVVGREVVLRSEDGGRSWAPVPLPSEVPDGTVLYAVTFRPGGATGAEVGVAVGTNSVILRTEDGGASWVRVPDAGSVFLEAVDHAGGDTWYAVGGGRIRRSTDDGRTWSVASLIAVDADGTPVSRPDFATFTAVEFLSEEVGVVGDARMADGRGRVYATRDGGETWRETNVITGHNDIAYNGRDGWVVVQYVGGQGRVLHSADLLESHDATENPLTFGVDLPNLAFWAVDFATPDIGFALAQGGPVYRTEDGGRTWARATGYPTPSHPGEQLLLDIDMVNANVGAIVGTGGALGATDSGGGFPTYETSGGVASEPVPEAALPPGVALAAPAPNPLRATTRVRYRLDAPGRVRLGVHDALGREVAVLVDDERPAGEHEATFEAAGLAAGVYIVRLRSAGAVVARPVTVLR